MPQAARYTDRITHTSVLDFTVMGAGAGLGIGVLIVVSAEVSVPVIIATVGFCIVTGASFGETLAKFKDPDECGVIAIGSLHVKVNNKFSARATLDHVYCRGKPPLFLPTHDEKRLATGSGTVHINGQPAARVGDYTECRAQIGTGSSNVLIGGPMVQTLPIDDEVPAAIRWTLVGIDVISTLTGLGLLSKLGWLGVRMLVGGLIGGEVGGKLLKGLAESIWGEGSPQAELAEKIGQLLGGAAGAKIGAGSLASCAASGKCTTGLEPVDMGSGRVVERETDLTLPGRIPLSWGRRYSSALAYQTSSLGRGGWTLDLEQWVTAEPGLTTLRDQEGRDVYFPPVAPGETAFHRSDRLELTALAGGAFEVRSLDTRLSRSFAPLAEGQRAVLRSIRDAYDNTITLAYTGDRLSRIVDTAGRELRVKHGPGGRLIRVEVWAEEELQQWVSYAYTERGELASATDALGNTESYAYDEQHRMVQKTLKNGVGFHYAYDERTGWCCRSWGDGGLHTGEIRVDLEKRVTYLEGNDEPRVYHWNRHGVVVREETPDGILIRTREYDADLYLIADANGAGETTRYEHDARGNKVREIDPAGNVTRWEYADDRPRNQIDPDGLETRFAWDAQGSLRTLTYPSGARRAITRDERGRVASIEHDDGLVTSFRHNARHEIVEERDTRGATTAYGYDALGHPTSRTDALGRTTTVEYDKLGRPLCVRQPDGNETRSAYDTFDNPIRVTDALGQVTEMEYGGTGALTKVKQPDGTSWAFKYTSGEKLRRINNPLGEGYEFTYDTAGRVTEEATFDGRTLRYGYSAAGRLGRVDYPDGSFRAFSRDPLGCVVEEVSPDGPIRFERDGRGRILGAVLEEDGERVVTSFQRDRFGRVVSETQGERTIRYQRDRSGRPTVRVMPDGALTRYEYDARGQLASVAHEGRTLTIQRDVLGRETVRGDAAGRIAIRSAYDAMDRLVEQQVDVLSPGGGVPAQVVARHWRYDPLGRTSQIRDARWGTTTYGYDGVGHLVEARCGAHHEVFEYDAAGSIQKMLRGLERLRVPTNGRARESWKIAPGNLLLQTERAAYAYDRRGRRILKQGLIEGERDQKTEYVWDCRDRLREVRLPSGAKVLFTYDAFGRRIHKKVVPGAGEETHTVDFIWDEDVLAADRDSRRGARCFVHEPGTLVPLLQAEQGEVFAVVNDHLGMPQELVDQNGRVAWSRAHSAWGQVVEAYRDASPARQAQVESPFRLLGQYADDETGLSCTRFRYFDAEVGRWCSPDPLEIAGGLNLYQFNGAPTVVVDPWGLACKTYQTYTKTNPETGEVYSGRTSGYGTPEENVAARDADHHMNDKGFGPAELDKSSSNPDAIRGREQQLIDANGGAKSTGGTSGNAINGVSRFNPKRGRYSKAANDEFGP